MGQRAHPSRLGLFDVEAKGDEASALRVGLDPDRIAVRQRDRSRVAKAANTAQRAERVVERAVLLHQNHNVLGVEITAAGRRLDRGGTGKRFEALPGRAGGAEQACREAEELASCLHGCCRRAVVFVSEQSAAGRFAQSILRGAMCADFTEWVAATRPSLAGVYG